ncbi:MAG TPA: fibrillarin-like rRNA/tRNA 2'-O-methyltransferase [Thermoplasmata archaeon]|nr:fibrillarin-like rRNA/tRNA 2'-O-methyltransferase [Thermoplasmata archaeon]
MQSTAERQAFQRVRSHELPYLYTDGRDVFTRSLTPGRSVYGERRVGDGTVEYRAWYPQRSKLAALVQKGCRHWPFRGRTRILYLGAASGTTASHLSDIATEGVVHCVEISPRAFQKLLAVAELRENMNPILADAVKPETYARQVGEVDVLYQDVSQRDQLGIFLKNARLLAPGGMGFLMVKSRSIDVAANPKRVFQGVVDALKGTGLQVLDVFRLEPYEKDHAAVIVRRTAGHGGTLTGTQGPARFEE